MADNDYERDRLDDIEAFVQAADDGDGRTVYALWDAQLLDDIDARRCDGWTALLVAVRAGHDELVAWLLAQGASPTQATAIDGPTALHLAVGCDQLHSMMMLLLHGADVDASSEAVPSALFLALESHDVRFVKHLLAAGASTDCRLPNGHALLHVAASLGSLEAVDRLLRAGADACVTTADGSGFTPMHHAANSGHAAIVQRLLAHDQSLALALTATGDTPLLRACGGGHLSVVTTLAHALGRQHPVFEQANEDLSETPLIVAAGLGHVHVLDFLLEQLHVSLEATDVRGYTALHVATNDGHVAVVARLVQAGASLSAVNRAGEAALQVAVRRAHNPIVAMLLAHDSVVDRGDLDGITALMTAASRSDVSLVHMLLRHGASVHARSHSGWSPVLFAAQNGHVEIVQLLIAHGARLDCASDTHWTPLMLAAQFGHASLCEFLLVHGKVSPRAGRTTDGRTVLHVAVAKGFTAIVELLMEHGANVHTIDHDGQTPAGTAVVEGHFDTLQLLVHAGAPALTEATYCHATWPLPIVLELYDRYQQIHTPVAPPTLPVWFIDAAEITALEPTPRLATPLMAASVGTWRGTRVLQLTLHWALCATTRITKHNLRQLFQREVSKWFPLRHPHVTRLFGACHRDPQLVLVVEHPSNGTLRSYLATHPSRVWTKLYEIALGLQYLHERGIVHGNLMGEHLLISEDGSAKLAGFGATHSSIVLNTNGTTATTSTTSSSSLHDEPFRWDAYEVTCERMKTMESDIYSFGMCIIEAVSGDVPYAAETAANRNVQMRIAWGMLPARPPGMSDRAWTLVTQMTVHEVAGRVKIADVVRELAVLARDETVAVETTIETSTDTTRLAELMTIAKALLLQMQDDEDRETDAPQDQVHIRVLDILAMVEAMELEAQARWRRRLGHVLTLLTDALQTRTRLSHAARFAAERQHANRIFSLHNDLDRILIEGLGIAGDPSTHAWRDHWHTHRRTQLQAFGEALADTETLDRESATCLLFELTRHRAAYTSISPERIHAACVGLRARPHVRVPDWFIPHYEVLFDERRHFSHGAFGSVHHGEWMGARAVIKKVFSSMNNQETETETETDTEFTKEVELWSQLYHPHVLQLFGASHVGDKFLVSEFATHGQLDTFLRRPTVHRRRRVWRLLLEAALGLQYLHARGIVHCDLKCNNILVGRDGKAKLSDYGLSHKTEQQQQQQSPLMEPGHDGSRTLVPMVGAPRWKAPEVLNGAAPTFASDVYSFAMCVVEAVTGQYPWGSEDPDMEVSFHVREGGRLFEQPREFSDAQWTLVVDASRFHPAERVSLDEMITRLEALAVASESEVVEEVGVDSAAVEPEPEQLRMSDSAAISKPTIVALVEDGARGVGADRTATATPNTSYSESW